MTIPFVSHAGPERHENPLSGSFSGPIQLDGSENGLFGLLIDEY